MSYAPVSGSGFCPRCGKATREAARFCDACGTPLRPDLDHVSRHFLEGEVKYITVLFADVVDSTQLVAGRSPDEAEQALNPALSTMVEAVQAFGGVINQLRGDGVMALFGAPQSQEDHALRACCAAIRMHEAVALSSGSHMQLRVGLASGLTLLSTSGLTVAGAYPAFGATIHLASRLQALAKPGTTLCGGSTRTLAGPTVDLVPLGPRAIRGFVSEEQIFVLAGMRQSVSRFSDAVVRGLSPLVGRHRELAELSAYAQAAREGAIVKVEIVGEAGAGKSRLAWEFVQTLQPDGWHVIQAEAVSFGHSVPYQLIGALLRSTFGIDAGDKVSESVRRVRRHLEDLGNAAVDCSPALLSLLGLPLEEDAVAWDRHDPLYRRDLLGEGVSTLFKILGSRRPVLLLLEDLQWADEQSLRLLDFDAVSDCQLLVLTTHRPDFESVWKGQISKRIAVKPLSPQEMSYLLQEAFPAIASRSLQQALISRSSGNPFFLEELARNALSTAIPEGGKYGEEEIAVPSTVQAVIAARLDKLAAEDKQVLVAASALGNRFPLRTLQGIFATHSEMDFQKHLKALSDSGLFQKIQPSDDEITFSHALIQEVAYTGLPRTQKRELHARIVEAIKCMNADRLDEQAEVIVYHAMEGEVWAELVDAARIAGRRAASRSAYKEASRIFEQGIKACEHLPHVESQLASEIDLRFALRNTLIPTSGIERSLENSTHAERLARQLGDKRRLGWATAYVASDLQRSGRPGAAIVAATRALELADGERNLTSAAVFCSAQAAYSRGDYESTVARLRGVIADLETHGRTAWAGTPGPSIIFFETWHIWALAQLGQAAEAAKVVEKMHMLADEANLPLCKTLAHLSEGFALSLADRMREAETTLRASLSLCRKWEFFAWSTNISSCLGYVLAHLGQFEEAFELIEHAVERTKSSGIFVNHAIELAWLAEAHRLAGRAEEAAQVAEKAIEIACLHEERGNEARATVVLAESLADLGSVVAAKAHCTAAMRLATECRMASLIERCRVNFRALNYPTKRIEN